MSLKTWLQSGGKKAEKRKVADQEGKETDNVSSSVEPTPSTSSANELGCKAAAEMPTDSAKRPRRKAARKYDPTYLKLGFFWKGTEEEPCPQCVVCAEVLCNDSMKPANLKRHLHTKHPTLKDKPVDFFQRKRDELKQSKATIRSCTAPSALAQEASYAASLLVAKSGQPHTICSRLCLPLAKKITQIMCGEKAAKQLDLVPLSADTVSRRIRSMSNDVLKTLTERIKNSRFYCLQLDETTDVADLANLLVYVRYEYEGKVREDFLCCQPLQTRTTAEHIFQLLDTFVQEHGIDWKRCIGVCTDGARAMCGRHSGVAARIREVAPEMRWTHCSIHREALAVKKMPDELKSVLDSAVKTVNFIKARPMHSRLFQVLCDEMGSEHVQLLLHTEVRWLSRGKVLSRLFELHKEVFVFLQDKNFTLSHLFEDTVWLSELAYLSDIFSRLNELNLGLQGLSVNVFDVQDKISAAVKKMELFEIRVKAGDVSPFPSLESFLSENDLQLDDSVRDNILAHVTSLRQQLREYFPVEPKGKNWIRNPFNIETSDMPTELNTAEQESLIELSCDETLKSDFKKQSLLDFWIQQHAEYPALSDKAVRILLPFATTYLCEKGFSSLAAIKTKYRSRLDAEPDLRLKLCSIEPDIRGLCAERQAHPSH